MRIIYILKSELLAIHSAVIEASGGLEGVHDEKLLEGCLEFIQDDTYYPTFEDKLTHLVFTIAKNHAFMDGNKRSSIGAGALFLLHNDFSEETTQLFIRKMECLVLHVVQNEISKQEMQIIISDYIHDGKLSEKSLQVYLEKGLNPDEVPK